ncbi:MAG: ArsR family transcriptional regulator [Candidatus Thorarchaeota archaeon]
MNDKELFVDGLMCASLEKNEALCLEAVVSLRRSGSLEIEKRTGLSQPVVSIALTSLRKRGWVGKKDLPVKGRRGRPTHLYGLKVSPVTVLEHIRDSEAKRIVGIQENLMLLEDYLKVKK